MAIDLSQRVPAPPAPPDLEIEPVRDEATLATWATTLAAVFERGAEDALLFARAFTALGLAPGSRWQHFLARVRGRAVGTSSLYLGGGTAGVYHVGTLAAVRGQGIGSALTDAALETASRRGVTTAVLQSSAKGLEVYRRLGFVERERLAAYERG
jgi:ribosomal protein S18 acetylase RimI-like enzyme